MNADDFKFAALAAHEVLKRGETFDPKEAAARGARIFRINETKLIALVVGLTPGQAMAKLRGVFNAK